MGARWDWPFVANMCELSELSELSRILDPCRRCESMVHTYIDPMHFDFGQEELGIYFCGPWKEELQHGSDALGPGGFCVFRTFCFEVSEVLA
jgi:hypothetical protein